jgi:hypothetical protein
MNRGFFWALLVASVLSMPPPLVVAETTIPAEVRSTFSSASPEALQQERLDPGMTLDQQNGWRPLRRAC